MSQQWGERTGISSRAALVQRVEEVLETHWTPAGYAAPNATTYPWQWLWDSCFHVLIWHELGRDDRAVRELEQVFSTQTSSGFVPHMNYQLDPEASVEFWGRRGASSITQPPMYGHAVASLVEAGVAVPPSLVDGAADGLRFLLERRQRDVSGLIELCHPWESGADDSPRWDDICPGRWTPDRWRQVKGDLVASLVADEGGSAVRNPDFAVASVGFNALVAWNARRLLTVSDDDAMASQVDDLIVAIDDRWDPELETWLDAGMTAEGSGRIRTADALLPLLVTTDADATAAVCRQLADPAAFGGRYGPPGVHRGERVYEPHTYWRGPVWPQLAYLLWTALRRRSLLAEARALGASTVRGAVSSEFAEYWGADDAVGLGAVPQSWTGLVIVMAD